MARVVSASYLSLTLTFLIAACSLPPESVPAVLKKRPAKVSEGRFGLELRAEASSPIDGDFPHLYLSCGEFGQHISFDVIQPPPSPPPLANVMGTIEVDGDRWTEEMSIGDVRAALWSPRSDAVAKAVAARVAGASDVRFRPPRGYGPPGVVVFDMTGVEGDISALREACSTIG